MATLHEVLAVDKPLEDVANKVVDEATNTFSKKPDHFTGAVKILKMYDDARRDEEAGFGEQKEITTTVQDKLDYVSAALAAHMDALAQKEETNQTAVADVILPDGTILLKSLPATLLLSLENKLAKWRAMYEAIPTLQPGIKWVQDEGKGKGAYRMDSDEVKHKTEKTLQTKVIIPPTDKQPGQYEKWTEDRPVGDYRTTRYSSMVTPARKSQLLKRIDILASAVKQARMRANYTQVVDVKIGKTVMNYINEE
jgi:hypothetical protein